MPLSQADERVLNFELHAPCADAQTLPMADIDQDVASVATLAADFLELTERACERGAEDPFGNPMLAVALAITPARCETMVIGRRDERPETRRPIELQRSRSSSSQI